MRATGENEVKFAREAGVFHHLTKYQGEQDDLEVEKMLQISRRAAQIAPYATLAIDTRAKALKAEGKDVVGFGAGEPDFDTPEYVRAAAHRAIDEGRTRSVSYTHLWRASRAPPATRSSFRGTPR